MSKKRRRQSVPRPAPFAAVHWLLAAVLVFMGGLMLFVTGHVSVLSARRVGPERAVDGVVSNSLLRILPLGSTPFTGLREAKLELVPDKKNSSSPTFRVLLVTEHGTIPVTSSSRGGRERHQEIVDRINERLADAGSDAFVVAHVGAGWFVLAPIVFVIGALAALLYWAASAVGRARASASKPTSRE